MVIGGLYKTKTNVNENEYYVVIQKKLTSKRNNETLYNCYVVFNTTKRDFDFFPAMMTATDFVDQIGTLDVVFSGQIPLYKEQFIDICPEFFI